MTEVRDSASNTTDQSDDEVDTQERYDRVLSVIHLNTGDPQPPGCRPRTIRKILVAEGPYSKDGVNSSLQAALDNGDVILWRDPDGIKRFTRTLDEDLRKLIGAENERDHPATELIAQAAEHIDDREAGSD